VPDVSVLIDTLVRPVEDWPEPGVTFRDITPLLADPNALRAVIDAMTDKAREIAGGPIDAVLGIEARGFIFAPPVALALGAGFIPVRKVGKLPGQAHSASYALEYGSATIEMHTDASSPATGSLSSTTSSRPGAPWRLLPTSWPRQVPQWQAISS